MGWILTTKEVRGRLKERERGRESARARNGGVVAESKEAKKRVKGCTQQIRNLYVCRTKPAGLQLYWLCWWEVTTRHREVVFPVK